MSKSNLLKKDDQNEEEEELGTVIEDKNKLLDPESLRQ